MLQKIAAFFNVYRDRKMLIMLALGFASGFPFPLVFNTLSLWLQSDNLALEIIGIFSLSKLPYSFKWLWAPLADKIRLPLLWKLGQRRSWALLSQALILLAILALACSKPEQHYLLTFALAVFLAFCSATLDIALDAYRVESFTTPEQAAASASFVTGYRFGFLFSGAGALYLAEVFSWNMVYLLMSFGTLVGFITLLLAQENNQSHQLSTQSYHSLGEFFRSAAIAPLKDFIKHQNWQLILLFVFFYRMSDAYMAPMAYPFYDDMGFSKIEIASVIKVYGVIATVVGTLVGGLLVSRFGIIKSLLWCGVLQGLSNLIFVWQAYAGHNIYVLMVTISIENISGGMSTAAFVAYLSSLCNSAYTATQYALLSSFMSLARDVFAATSGFVAGAISWAAFFVLTSLMSVPALIILLYLVRKRSFGEPKLYKAGANK